MRLAGAAAGESPDERERGLAVGAKQTLAELHPLVAAVALDLAFVGGQLEPRDATGPQKRRQRGLERGQDGLEKLARRTVEANPQVRFRIRVAEEEPPVDGAGQGRGDGPHAVAQEIVDGPRGAVDLAEEPLAPRGELAPEARRRVESRRRLQRLPGRRSFACAEKRNDDMAGVAAVGALGDEVLGLAEQLDELNGGPARQ